MMMAVVVGRIRPSADNKMDAAACSSVYVYTSTAKGSRLLHRKKEKKNVKRFSFNPIDLCSTDPFGA